MSIVTILGGSAASTPWLIDYLAQHHPKQAHTIRLAGRTQTHLEAVSRACRLVAQASALRIESYQHREWADALKGADTVLIQIREGGLEARLHDETFPRQYGIPGDEGLGPGGLSAAIRTWPVLRDLLALVEKQAPKSRKLLLTSPAGLLIGAAASQFPGMSLYALCELPFTTLQSITREPVEFGYTGVNHLGWLHDIRSNGVPLVSQPVPLKYLRLHFDRENARREPPRAPQLMRIREHAYQTFTSGDGDEIRAALALRPAPWYTHAIGPLLAGVRTQPYFVTQPGLAGERACRWEGKFIPLPSPAPPRFIREFVDAFLEYETEALPAVLDPTPENIEHALRCHPWSGAAGPCVTVPVTPFLREEFACPL